MAPTLVVFGGKKATGDVGVKCLYIMLTAKMRLVSVCQRFDFCASIPTASLACVGVGISGRKREHVFPLLPKTKQTKKKPYGGS